MKRILLVLGLLVAAVACTAAGATNNDPGDCVPTADHFQRYSWTGGPIPDDPAPAFPDANWQPNVEGDPHGIGHAGAYFVSHGASGGGDWFYLELIEGTDCPTPTTAPPTTVATTAPPTTQTPPTSSIPDDPPDEPTGSLDVDKTVHGDPDCEADEPCFVVVIDCEDQVTRQQVYDRTGHLIDGPSTFHDIPSDDVCVVVETVTGGADSVTYDPPNASTTGVVITPEDPDSDVDQRVHVVVTNWFDPECEYDCEPPTTVPTTTIPPPTTEPTTTTSTTVPPPVCTVPTDCVPPPCFDPMCPPPTTDTVPPPPPRTVPPCGDDPGQPGCAELARTGNDSDGKVHVGLILIAAGSALWLGTRRKRAA
jgi:hypothetical protein